MNNDDVVRGGGGFGTHGHRDMEIVTWVLQGELAHRDSTGTDGIIYPGLAQRMSAGSGIRHSEMNASATADVHLVQMWVLPDTAGHRARLRAARPERRARGRRPGRRRVGAGTRRRGVDPPARRACCRSGASVPARRSRSPTRRTCTCSSPWATPSLDGTALATGDAARLTDAGSPSLTAGTDGAEVLVWADGAERERRRRRLVGTQAPGNGDTSGPPRRTTACSSASRPAARATRWSTSWSPGPTSRPGIVVGFDFSFSLPEWFLRDTRLRRARARSGMPPRPTVRRGCATASRRSGAVRAGPDPTCPRTCAAPRPRSPRSAGSAPSRRSRSAGPAASAPVRSAASPPWPDCRTPATRSGRSTHRRRPPVAVEIWPRTFTGPVVKSDAAARAAHLDAHLPRARTHRGATRPSAAKTRSTPQCRRWSCRVTKPALRALPALDDPGLRTEGCVWSPAPVATSAG